MPSTRSRAVGGELRARIGAATAARVQAGTEPDEAERLTIEEQGDPERRLADLEGRPAFLIGPAWFFGYRRIMVIALPAVAASVFAALVLAQSLAGTGIAATLATAFAVAFSTTAQVGFWITVVFAVLERVVKRPRTQPWDVSDLPDIPRSRIGLGGTIAAVLAYLVFIGLVVWQGNIWVVRTAGGDPVPLLDPALWEFWIPWFLGLAVLEIVFALAAFGIGRWTWALASTNVALNLAFAVPAIWLLASGVVVSDEFRTVFPEAVPAVDAVVAVLPYVIAVAAALDIIDGFRRASRAGGAPR